MSTPEEKLKPEPEMSPDELIDFVGREYRVPKGLRQSLFKRESGGQQYNADGSVKVAKYAPYQKAGRGMGQLIPGTAKSLGVNPDDPVENVVGSMHYLKSLYDQARPNSADDAEAWAKATAGYFSGPGNMGRAPGQVFQADRSDGRVKVSEYVEGVLSGWADYDGPDNDWDESPAPVPPSQGEAAGAPLTPQAGPQTPAIKVEAPQPNLGYVDENQERPEDFASLQPRTPKIDPRTEAGRAQRDVRLKAEKEGGALYRVPVSGGIKRAVETIAKDTDLPPEFVESWLGRGGFIESSPTGFATVPAEWIGQMKQDYRASLSLPQRAVRNVSEVLSTHSPGEVLTGVGGEAATGTLRGLDLATRPIQGASAAFWAKVKGADNVQAVQTAWEEFRGENPELAKNIIAEALRNSDRLKEINPRLPGLAGFLAEMVADPANVVPGGLIAKGATRLGRVGRAGGRIAKLAEGLRDIGVYEPDIPREAFKAAGDPSVLGDLTRRTVPEASMESLPDIPVSTLEAPRVVKGGEPPIPAGHIRLYRGEGQLPPGAASRNKADAGRWFTDNKALAEDYAESSRIGERAEPLKYVDVPADEAAKMVRRSGNKPTEYVVTDEHLSRARPLRAESPRAETAISEAVQTERPPVAGQQAQAAPVTETIIKHSDPRIDGGKVIGSTSDGRLRVENNEGGVSIVQHPRKGGNREAALVRREVVNAEDATGAPDGRDVQPLAPGRVGAQGRQAPVRVDDADAARSARTDIGAGAAAGRVETGSPLPRAATSAPDRLNAPALPEKAPEGKTIEVKWADGRAVQYFDNQDAARKFYDDKLRLDDEPDMPRLIDTPKGARVKSDYTPETAMAPAPRPPKGPDFGKGLTRNYQAGMNRAEITFGSLEQRDLYDAYSQLRGKVRNESQAAAKARVDKAQVNLDRLSRVLNVPREQMMKLAGDVYDDVRAQMRGVKDGETRTITDNVRPAKIEAPALDRLSAPVPDPRAFRAQMKKAFNLDDAKADEVSATADAFAGAWAKVNNKAPEDWYLRFAGIERGENASKKAATRFIEEDGRAILTAFEKADVSSAWHELSHVFRRDLPENLLRDAEESLGVKGGKWETPHEERFARGFERYLKTGEAPSVKLRRVFEAAKQWLTEIYGAVRGKNHPLTFKPNEKLTAVFDRMLGGEPKGEYGQLIHALHKAPDAGTPAFFENAQVKRALGLKPDATTADVRAALTEAVGKPRSSHLSPEDVRGWADSKGLQGAARVALDDAVAKFEAKAGKVGTATPDAPEETPASIDNLIDSQTKLLEDFYEGKVDEGRFVKEAKAAGVSRAEVKAIIADARDYRKSKADSGSGTQGGGSGQTQRGGGAGRVGEGHVGTLYQTDESDPLGIFARASLSRGGNERRVHSLGPVSDANAERVLREAGVDLTGYERVVDNYAVRHIIKEHGDPRTEEPRGQVAVTPDDVARIPEIVEGADSVENVGRTRVGREAVRYAKRFNGTTYYVEEVRTGRRQVVPTSMWKVKEGRPQPPSLRPDAPSSLEARRPNAGTADAEIIDPPGGEGNDILFQSALSPIAARARAAAQKAARKPTFKEQLADVANAPRSLKSSIDLSAAMRQGAMFTLTHPFRASRIFFGKQLKSLSNKGYESFVNDLKADPDVKAMQDAGLHLTSLAPDRIGQREEAFASKLAGKVPLVQRSEHAYVTFLDAARSQWFKQLKTQAEDAAKKSGKAVTKEQYETIAKFINRATGRGDLGRGALNDAAPLLNSIFFAPRYAVSKVQVFDPRMYAQLPPGARRMALRQAAQYFATIGATALLLKEGFGADVGTDPEQSDFLKLRIGNTRYDLAAGQGQYVTLAARLLREADNNRKDEDTKVSRILDRFTRYKYAPVPAAIRNVWEGKDAIGKKTSVGREALNLVTPIYLTDLYEAFKQEGMTGIGKNAPGFIGIGVQTYEDKPLSTGRGGTLAPKPPKRPRPGASR